MQELSFADLFFDGLAIASKAGDFDQIAVLICKAIVAVGTDCNIGIINAKQYFAAAQVLGHEFLNIGYFAVELRGGSKTHQARAEKCGQDKSDDQSYQQQKKRVLHSAGTGRGSYFFFPNAVIIV